MKSTPCSSFCLSLWCCRIFFWSPVATSFHVTFSSWIPFNVVLCTLCLSKHPTLFLSFTFFFKVRDISFRTSVDNNRESLAYIPDFITRLRKCLVFVVNQSFYSISRVRSHYFPGNDSQAPSFLSSFNLDAEQFISLWHQSLSCLPLEFENWLKRMTEAVCPVPW